MKIASFWTLTFHWFGFCARKVWCRKVQWFYFFAKQKKATLEKRKRICWRKLSSQTNLKRKKKWFDLRPCPICVKVMNFGTTKIWPSKLSFMSYICFFTLLSHPPHFNEKWKRNELFFYIYFSHKKASSDCYPSIAHEEISIFTIFDVFIYFCLVFTCLMCPLNDNIYILWCYNAWRK